MDREKIIQFQQENVTQTFQSECSYQFVSVEKSINFLEEFFLWATNEISQAAYEVPPKAPSETIKYYEAEGPLVIEEAREAMRILRFISEKSQ